MMKCDSSSAKAMHCPVSMGTMATPAK
jgi:hypothetical protein